MKEKNQNQIVEPNKKVSSVEWLADQVEDYIGLIPTDIIDKAKEMHKKEMIKFTNDYLDDDQDITAEQ